MKKISYVGLVLLMWMLSANTANATLLGSYTNDVYWYTMSNIYPDINRGMLYQLGLTDSDMLNRLDKPDGSVYMFSEPAFVPFESRLTFNDIGKTFTINSANYNYWDQMVDHLLVDGDPMYVCKNQGAIDVSSYPFEWNFSQAYTGQGNDFKSYNIDNLLITINDLQIKQLNQSNEYYWLLSSTLSVDGHHGQDNPVPEPSTLVLIGASLLSFLRSKNRKRRP